MSHEDLWVAVCARKYPVLLKTRSQMRNGGQCDAPSMRQLLKSYCATNGGEELSEVLHMAEKEVRGYLDKYVFLVEYRVVYNGCYTWESMVEE